MIEDEAHAGGTSTSRCASGGPGDRRGRATAAVGAALLVVVAFSGCSGHSSEAAPNKHPKDLADLPAQKGPVHAPYVVGSTLYAGGQTIKLAGPVRTIAPIDHGVIVEYDDGHQDGRDEIDEVNLTTHAMTLLTKGADNLVSDGSRYVAWRTVGTSTTNVVVHQIKEGFVDTDIPAPGQCCGSPFVIDGITPSGQLIGGMTSLDRYWSWSFVDADDGELSDSEPAAVISGLRGQSVAAVVGDKIVVSRTTGTSRVATIAADGTLSAAATWASVARDAALSASGREYSSSLAGDVFASKLGATRSDPVRLWLPRGVHVKQAMSDDATHDVLLISTPEADASTTDALARCDFVTGACTLIQTIPAPSAG
ncbi:MAG TPA: hypothetical protein VHZ06_09240 [Marmoricola sp.]|nr:hypothetical protein [Marmoricola sp.]